MGEELRVGNRWAIECRHYFNEWLKCVTILELKSKQQQEGG